MAGENDPLKVSFHTGPSTEVDDQIASGSIGVGSFVVGSDDDILYYVNRDKEKHALSGGSKTKTDITVNTGGAAIGGIQDKTTISAGTSLDDFIKKLLTKQVPPIYTAPVATLVTGADKPSAKAYEVGTEITTTFVGDFIQNDAGALTKLELFKDGSDKATTETDTKPLSSEVTFSIPNGNVTFAVKATYAEGAVKKDNLGQDYSDGHIAAGNVLSKILTFSGKFNTFYGSGIGKAPEVTSDTVRGLANSQLGLAKGASFNMTVAKGQQYVVIAYPSNLTGNTGINSIKYVEQSNTEMKTEFALTKIAVEGANGVAGADYNVYVYAPAVPAAADMTFSVTI